MSIPKKSKQTGFALIEVMFAIVILAFGLLALAALLAQLSGSTTTSRYLGSEVMLASEKLEDLNQLDYKTYKAGATSPLLAAGGSLTANKAGYFDQVQISSRSGMMNDPTGPAQAANDFITFQRRWVIETDTPSAGVQRITVIVIPQTGTPVERAETFQTSTVRACDVNAGC
ncbi:MAG TPA: prepilin-type N-terminal cleavage/methylation domain-containing protein [Candidatus Angelobacter sp.]|jgi:type II secretory pathway pseudopilin PulG